MHQDLTTPALAMGATAAFVGYSASFAIVLAGIAGVGATPEQAATGLFFATLGMGLCSIWLPWRTRVPAAIAWSTPAAAFLASSTPLPGGFAEAVGALILAGLLILLTGLIPALGRAVSKVPKPLANALLAGVLLKLCLAPAIALGSIPLLTLPVLAAWLIGLCWKKIAAMPFAVAAFLITLFLASGHDTGSASNADLVIGLPELAPIIPIFSWQAMISFAVPVYLVTMAGQNIPGFAVLELNKYPIDQRSMLRSTGIASVLIAPFGAIPVNMSAITAAMMAGEDAGPDRNKRYWAAIASGLVYIPLTLAAGIVASLAALAPSVLIASVAGLALIPAFAGSISGAFGDKTQWEAPALTFFITASGMTLLGVSGAFWGLLIGAVVWYSKQWRTAPEPA